MNGGSDTNVRRPSVLCDGREDKSSLLHCNASSGGAMSHDITTLIARAFPRIHPIVAGSATPVRPPDPDAKRSMVVRDAATARSPIKQEQPGAAAPPKPSSPADIARGDGHAGTEISNPHVEAGLDKAPRKQAKYVRAGTGFTRFGRITRAALRAMPAFFATAVPYWGPKTGSSNGYHRQCLQPPPLPVRRSRSS